MNEGIAFRLLVLEDSKDDRFVIDAAFKELHYQAEVKKFITARALFRYLTAIDPALYPSLIVVDHYLVRDDTRHVLTVLKNNPQTAAIPVIIYSAGLPPASREALMAAGADAIFRKPDTAAGMLELCRHMINIAEHAGKTMQQNVDL